MYLTLGGLRHPKRADDLADAIFGANAVWPHVPALDDLGGGNLRVRGLCGEEWGEIWLVWRWTNKMCSDHENHNMVQLLRQNISRLFAGRKSFFVSHQMTDSCYKRFQSLLLQEMITLRA